MKESDLYIPVRDWLRSRGYSVHIEIFDADIVGLNDAGHIVVVELKTGMTSSLFEQLVDRARWADEVWAAVPPTAKPPGKGFSNFYGFGLLIVNGEFIRQRRHAKPQPYFRFRTRKYRLKVLRSRRPAEDHHVAGLPSCATTREQHQAARRAG